MKIPKKDLIITYNGENCYRLSMRKKFLFFFNCWIPLTYQEAENSKEEPIEFKTLPEAQSFLENISD